MGCHHHHHPTGDASESRLRFAFFLNLSFTVIELIGGIWTNSVAIISDAVHDLGDSLALGMAWGLERFSKREKDLAYSFGYRRFSLAAAFLSSMIILIGVGFVLWEAIPRLNQPQQPNTTGMALLALLGLFVNGLAAWRLGKGQSLNEKTVTWHLIEDVLGWAAVLLGSFMMMIFDWPMIDPILAILISLLVGRNIFRHLKETVSIFLQAVPNGLSIETIESSIKEHRSINNVHHTQVWSLDGQSHVMTSHVSLSESLNARELMELKINLRQKLKSLFQIEHTTIEFEFPQEHCEMDDNLQSENT